MKEFLKEVLAELNAGNTEKAKEMIRAKIAELENPIQTMDDGGNGGDGDEEPPLPGEGNNY